MDKRDLLAVEYELEARKRSFSRIDRWIKVISYAALATVVFSMFFVRGDTQRVIFLIAFILTVSANLLGLFRGQNFQKYIWNSLKQGSDDNINKD